MKKLLLLLALLPAALIAQVPALTDNSILRYREGNTVFDHTLSELRTGIFSGYAWATNTLSSPTYTPGMTSKIFHNGPVVLKTDTPRFRWYATGLGQAKADSVALYIRSNNGSSDNTPAAYIRNYGNAPYNPLVFDMDSTVAPAGTPFSFFQSYYPANSAAGDNMVHGYGFNIDKNTNRLIAGKGSAFFQFEENFYANTPTGDMEFHYNFNPSASGDYRPLYFTAGNTTGANSIASISGSSIIFSNGGADAAETKGT